MRLLDFLLPVWGTISENKLFALFIGWCDKENRVWTHKETAMASYAMTESFIINSRKYGKFEFKCDSSNVATYIWVSHNDRMWAQPCVGGAIGYGHTLNATPATLEKICRRWYRNWKKKEKDDN